jgi:hypothetical protein
LFLMYFEFLLFLIFCLSSVFLLETKTKPKHFQSLWCMSPRFWSFRQMHAYFEGLSRLWNHQKKGANGIQIYFFFVF